MFVADVAAGNAFVTPESTLPEPCCPPQGHDSVVGEVMKYYLGNVWRVCYLVVWVAIRREGAFVCGSLLYYYYYCIFRVVHASLISSTTVLACCCFCFFREGSQGFRRYIPTMQGLQYRSGTTGSFFDGMCSFAAPRDS